MEEDLKRVLREALKVHNAYAWADRTTRPTYAAYKEAQKSNRRRVRQCVRDLRWARNLTKERSRSSPE